MNPWAYRLAGTGSPTTSLRDAVLYLSDEDVKLLLEALFGGKPPVRARQAMRPALQEALQSRRGALPSAKALSPADQVGLGLLRLSGGAARAAEYTGELLVFPHGARRRASQYYHNAALGPCFDVLEHALANPVLFELPLRHVWESPYCFLADAHLSNLIWSCPEFWSAAPIPVPPPLVLETSPPPSPGRRCSYTHLLRRLLSLLGRIQQSGRLALTGQQSYHRGAVTRLRRLAPEEAALADDPLSPLRDATRFGLGLLVGAGCLRIEPRERCLLPASTAGEIFDLPVQTQLVVWVRAYLCTTGWGEYLPTHLGSYHLEGLSPTGLNVFRSALVAALGALPDPEGWYSFPVFLTAVRERTGGAIRFSNRTDYPLGYGRSDAETEARRRQWAEQQEAGYQANERVWAAHVLRGPLYQFGLLELAPAPEGSFPEFHFRLTELGRVVLYDRFRTLPEHALAGAAAAEQPQGPCWIVQPNLEVTLFPETALPADLAFLSRIGAPLPGAGPAAHFRLSRESICAGLQSGLEVEELLRRLQARAMQPVAPSVLRSIVDWARRREQIVVHTNASLLEYENQAARDAALAAGTVQGRPLADRFVVLAMEPPPNAIGRLMDYARSRYPSLYPEETGRIRLAADAQDLFVRSELARWADPSETDPDLWHITAGSLRRARRARLSADHVYTSLQANSRISMPPLLQHVIRARAEPDRSPAARLEEQILLQLADDELTQALAYSHLFKGLLAEPIGRRVFLVPRHQAETLRERLQALGLLGGESPEVEPPTDTKDKRRSGKAKGDRG
ncbi:MAG: hypothetical protein FJX77_09220 [Armatimonadetes bacterium]|nr:hypothetical protein [Armatimonadota bacterium]